MKTSYCRLFITREKRNHEYRKQYRDGETERLRYLKALAFAFAFVEICKFFEAPLLML
jgi:hypothetical protein